MKKVILTKGQYALVSDEDFNLVSEHRWHAISSPYGYRACCKGPVVRGKRETIYLSRFIVDAKDGEIVDHINHNTLDNRRPNLRICDASQSCFNCRKHKHSKHRYKGVTWDRNSKINPWRANIYFRKKRIFLGMFPTQKEAAKAYDKKAKELHGKYAYLNFR